MKGQSFLFSILLISTLFSGGNLKAQNTDTLDNKQQQIVAITTNIALEYPDTLKKEIEKGFKAGLTTIQIRKILAQLYPYAGYDRTLSGVKTLFDFLDKKHAENKKDAGLTPDERMQSSFSRGTFKKLMHDFFIKADNSPSLIDTLLLTFILKDTTQNILSPPELRIATISALVALNHPTLQAYINTDTNDTISKKQLEQIIAIIRRYQKENEN